MLSFHFRSYLVYKHLYLLLREFFNTRKLAHIVYICQMMSQYYLELSELL